MGTQRFFPLGTPSLTANDSLMLLGPSIAMSTLWLQVRRLAPQIRTTLITSAADCGAESVARLIWQLSAQPHRPFINLPLAEAELRFTHAERALSGIASDTFYFVPGVETLSLPAQQGLIRILKHRRTHSFTLVASTTEDLSVAVSVGAFMPELLSMLASVRIAVPSLSERPEDLPMLLQQAIFMRCSTTQRTSPRVSNALLRCAMAHGWTENFRELLELVEHLLAGIENKTELNDKDWGRAIQAYKRLRPQPEVRMRSLEAVLQEHVHSVLVACKGHKSQAADILGISRSSLYRITQNMREGTSRSLAK